MQQADILVLPSLSEGMPVVAVKALGYGLSIVGSDIPGLYDVVTPYQNGYLCPVNDLDDFEQALRILLTLEDKLLNMKQASLQKAAAFNLIHIVKQYEKIFYEITS